MHGREGKQALMIVKPDGPSSVPETIPNHTHKVLQ
jgi:hypothetical protein